MEKDIYRVVTKAPDGTINARDFTSLDDLVQEYPQSGTDNCSMNSTLRGLPIFHGLIGPLPEGTRVVRYESPDVFIEMTHEWYAAVPVRTVPAKGFRR